MAQDVTFTSVNPTTDVLTISNPGSSMVNLTNYQLCLGPGTYVQIGSLTPISGSIMLAPGADVELSYSGMETAADGLSLFSNSNFGSSNAADLISYVQWGAANQARVSQAVTAGRWDNANNFVSGNAPYTTTTGGSAASWSTSCVADGGVLTGGPFSFTTGDGIADNIPEGAITVANSQGENFAWVVTDAAGYILGLPPTFSAVDFDGAGAGNCLVWYLAWDGEITGAEPGKNANDIEGCFDLSNSILVERNNASGCDANGGDLFGGPFSFTTGDGIADNIPEGAITVANSQGENFAWVVTDAAGYILGLPPTFSAVDFDGAGEGVCLVWYLAWEGTITGLEVDLNANDIQGCFDLSNPITVNRLTGVDCSSLSTDDFSAEFDFALYPNPTKNSLTMKYKGNQSLDLDIQVFDMLGKQIMSKTLSTRGEMTLDFSDLNIGTYFLNILDKDSGFSTTKRVVRN
ncbi:hypothetical protein GCM10023315_11840 [Algibacter aquimarinus]|uniref:Secretion system C-terminal sorting domain-containing protein n=2 Tax=Algibacter aquimarinus TaxID=1136748 RepID=A0ABP9H9A4_9FLAO